MTKSMHLCTGPGQLNHINDNPHIYAGNNPSTRVGPAWTNNKTANLGQCAAKDDIRQVEK